MDQTNDGGKAFPCPEYGDTGMTLRDYFAGQAMQGILATGGKIAKSQMWGHFTGFESFNISDACELSYLFADCMIAEREKQEGR